MNSSGHFTDASPRTMPARYPTGAAGDWRTFWVGAFLIFLFLSAVAFTPTGTELVPGAPSMQDTATRPTTPKEALREALVLQERYTQTKGGEGVFAEAQTAEDQ